MNKPLIAIVAGVVLVGGIVGWKVWKAQQANEAKPTTTTTSSSSTASSTTKTTAAPKFTAAEGEVVFSGGYADAVTFKVGDAYHMLLNRFGTNVKAGQSGYFLLTSTTGSEWTEEAGTLFPGIATGRVMQFGDQYRFYYPEQQDLDGTKGSNIKSAISDDGKSFDDEDGIRVAPRAGYSLEGMTVFALADGTYRMYFNENLLSSAEQKVSEIWGASSTDGLSWTRDATPTLEYEATVEGVGGQWKQMLHPFVLARPKGGYVMFYNSHSRVYAATSDDGLSWTKQPGIVIADGADVDGYYLDDTTIKLFYGDFDPATGGLIYQTTITEE